MRRELFRNMLLSFSVTSLSAFRPIFAIVIEITYYLMKPYIICHMMASVDGRIDCDMTERIGGNEYYDALEQLHCDSDISGRVTMQKHFALPELFEAKDFTPIGKPSFYKACDAEGYTIAVDSKGRLRWPANCSEGRPLLVITGENAPKEYAEALRQQGISWIAAGKDETDLTQAGVLTVPTGATVKHGQTTLTKTSTADNKDSYNLAALISESDWGSQDIVVTVSKQGLEDVSVTWSSPAAENEINGFGSVKATNEFTANPHSDSAVSVIPEHNGRKGVAQIECRKTEQDPGWANFRYGAPLLTVAQAAVYTSNPYAYIAIDIAANKNVTVDFRVDNEVKGKFTATTEWQTWRLPASLFDAAKFASGAIFSNVETGGSKPTIYIDSVRFEIVTPEIVANVTEAGILTVPTASVVKVGNKTLVKTGTADNKDSYNLAAETNNSVWGSQDVVASIVLGEKSATVTWSSPAGEGEINGFGSEKARNNFKTNQHTDVTVSFVDSYTDKNGVTKNGVAKLALRNNTGSDTWANFRFGKAMLTEEAANAYVNNANAYVVITMMVKSKDDTETSIKVDYSMGTSWDWTCTVTSEWKEYKIPIRYFAYPSGGDHPFLNATNNDGVVDQTLYIDSIRLVAEEPAK